MALFGEKYGDEVRVVSMGKGVRGGKAGKPYSVELCGGTHVGATGEIGLVRILGESAVGAGVRRIEALTGESARAYLAEQDERVRQIAATLKVQPGEVLGRVEALMDERKKLEKELAEARKKLAMGGGSAAGTDAGRDINGVLFLGRVVTGVDPKDLKGLADEGKASLGSGVVTLIGVSADGKASAVVAVTEDLVGKISAVDLVRIASTALGGKGGGGRPTWPRPAARRRQGRRRHRSRRHRTGRLTGRRRGRARPLFEGPVPAVGTRVDVAAMWQDRAPPTVILGSRAEDPRSRAARPHGCSGQARA